MSSLSLNWSVVAEREYGLSKNTKKTHVDTLMQLWHWSIFVLFTVMTILDTSCEKQIDIWFNDGYFACSSNENNTSKGIVSSVYMLSR